MGTALGKPDEPKRTSSERLVKGRAERRGLASVKICSLIPSGTEILFALGLGDQVVGVTSYCNHPPEARKKRVVSKGVIDIFRLTAREVDEKVQELAKTGQPAYVLEASWLADVKPDLILTQDMCRSCDLQAEEVFQVILDFEQKPVVLLLNPHRLADVFSNLRRVAETAGVPERASKIVDSLRSRVQKVTRLVSQTSYRPRVLFLEWMDPPSPAGDWIPEQVELAGGIHELGKIGLPPVRMSWEAVVQCDPDVIIVGPCSHSIPRSLREMLNVVQNERWWGLKAVKTGEVYIVNSAYFDRPGPRIVDGIEILAQLLHPELFTGLIPPDTVVKLHRSSDERSTHLEQVAGLFCAYP